MTSAEITTVLLVIGAALFLLWVWMVVDCLRWDDRARKVPWLLGLFFLSWVGAVLYFVLVYRNRHALGRPSPRPPSPTAFDRPPGGPAQPLLPG